MTDDYYALLGTARNASDTEIRTAHEAALKRLAADTAVSSAERAATKRELDIAVRTLTSKHTRQAYDASLIALQKGAEGGNWTARLGSPLLWAGIAVIVAIAGAAYWQQEREQARLRVEREQAAIEQAEQRKIVEAKRAVERERQRVLDEIRLQREAEETQRQAANEVRKAEVADKQFVADDRIPHQEQRLNVFVDRVDSYRRQAEERQQRYDEARSLSQAQAEVARQKRYLEQREREEQYARSRRDANARYNN